MSLFKVRNPPRAEDDPLSCRLRAIADRVERRVGQLGRAIQEEGVELPVEVVRRGHAVRSCDVEDVLSVGLEAGPERSFRVMHAGLDRPDGNAESLGDLGQRKAEVVVEDQDGALLDGEPSEGALELVAVFDGQVLVGPVHGLDGQEPDLLRPARRRLASV